MSSEKGIYYAIGVGPGEPGLITKKALDLLEGCEVIAAPVTKSGAMMALDIVKGVMDVSGKEIVPISFTMSRDVEARKASYKEAAEKLEKYMDEGKDVMMINIGDVSIYSTAYYVLEFVREDGYETAMIPGVTSFSACAAVLGRSITEIDLPFHVIPAGGMDLDIALKLPGSKVLMKSGKSVYDTVEKLKEYGLAENAALVADCGLPTEQVITDLNELPENLSYFATIIAK